MEINTRIFWNSRRSFCCQIAVSSKSKEVKKLKGVIKENKKKEKLVEKEIKVLEESKVSSKKEIGNLKRKLTNTKKNTQKMEEAFTEDNSAEAADFLKKFAKK